MKTRHMFFGVVFFGCHIFFNAKASEVVSAHPVVSNDVFSLNIKEAVDLTLKNNTDIKVAEASVDEESARGSGVWGALLPKVDYGYLWLRQKGSVDTGVAPFEGNPYNSYKLGFDFNQPLIAGGALWSGPIAQSAKIQRAKVAAEVVERDQLMAMAKAYYSLLLYQEQVSTLKRQYETQGKLIAQAKQRFRVGAERKLTVLQFETQAALLRPQIIEAENNAQTSAVKLLNLIGKSDVSSIQVRGSLESVMKYQPISPRDVNLDSRAEIRELVFETRALDASKAVTMAEHWPTVSLTGHWGNLSYTRAELFSPNTREWNYGLKVTIPIFSGLTSFAKRQELAAQTAGLYYRERSVRDKSAIELVQTEKTLRTSQELISAKKIAFDLAKRSYAEASSMFRFGTLMYRDFFDIERDLINAELSYYASLYNHIEAAMAFHVATGQDLKTFFSSMGG